MIQNFISLFSVSYPRTIVYMLQNTEYQVGDYLKWLWRTKDFRHVAKRRTLNPTKAARLLLLSLCLGILVEIIAGIVLIVLGVTSHLAGGVAFGIALIVVYPVLWAYVIVLPLLIGRYFIALPKQRELIAQSERIFAKHPGIKLAVAGSYGKTTMKELLATVLAEKLDVAATPANKNVAITHAVFARKLTGKEDVLIIEYGEGAPGDVSRFAMITHPTYGVITGLAPAHLDHYKTLTAAGTDIFSLAKYVRPDHIFVNADSPSTHSFMQPQFASFDIHGSLGWKIADVQLGLSGTSFRLSRGKQSFELTSGLIGRHQVTTLAFVASFGLSLGLSQKQVQAGVAKTLPFEHRMQPYQLGGAWIIDDTYNGNIEGIRVGTALLQELPATRKIYVSPGLVDQGPETEQVHQAMGRLIAGAHPDIVVLMRNSVTPIIEAALKAAKYEGEIRIEDQPLEFYTNLEQFVAAGDLILLQNDWTDNYA